MKRLEFKIAMQQFGVTDRIGTYKVNGIETDMFLWHDSIFYFDGQGKVIVVGYIPMELGHYIFVNFQGNPNISFENDNRGQWFLENITLDPRITEEEKNNLLSKKLHRIYTIDSLKTLLAFLIFIDRFDTIKDVVEEKIDYDNANQIERQLEHYVRFDNLVDEYYQDIHFYEEVLTGLKLGVIADAPKMPAHYTIPKVAPSPEIEILHSTLDEFDFIVNPFQFTGYQTDAYVKALHHVAVDINHNEDNDKRKIEMSSRSSNTYSTYESDKKRLVYSGVKQLEEYQYVRINHIYSRYLPNMPLSGELVELVFSCSRASRELTPRSQVFNLTENRIFKDGKWQTTSTEELAELTRWISSISKTIGEDITSYFHKDKKMEFKKITEKKD